MQEDPGACILEVIERIVAGTSLPSHAQGFRARFTMCDWERQALGQSAEKMLGSFRVITRPATYYTQFVVVNGLPIKAHEKVDSASMIEAAKVISVMTDGRRDIGVCLSEKGLAIAIVPDGDPVTALPEFTYLKGKEDMWGQSHDSTDTPGLGGYPVSATSEQLLRPDPGYPVRRDTHEPAHHLENCFTEKDHMVWGEIYEKSVERVHEIFGFDRPPFNQGFLVNPSELFAGLTSSYFRKSDLPSRHMKQLLPEAYEFLEEFYGVLTPTETDHPGWIQYVTTSGIPLPWLYPAGGIYKHPSLGYEIDVLPGLALETEGEFYTSWHRLNSFLSIDYIDLSDFQTKGDELTKFATWRRARHESWAQSLDGYEGFEITKFEKESVDGQDSYLLLTSLLDPPRY